MLFGGALIICGWGMVWWCRKSYSGPAEIASFSSEDFSQSNNHDTFWHVVSTGYFGILFLWAIAVYLFQILCSMKSVVLLKYTLRFFIFRIYLTVKHCSYFFLIKTMVYWEKKLSIEKKVFFCRLCKNCWITCCTHMTSHAIWVDEITDVMISIKKINKN